MSKSQEQIAELIRESIVDSLVAQQPMPVATGRLASSIEVQPTEDGFDIYAEDYYQWVENGRKRGGFPPIKPIMEWIRAKGLKPRGGTSTEQFAYAIRYNLTQQAVKTKGKLPKSPARPFLEEGIANVGDDVLENYVINIEEQIDKAFE